MNLINYNYYELNSTAECVIKGYFWFIKTREKDIRDVYEKYGDIKEINLKYRKATIEYKEEESAEEAY